MVYPAPSPSGPSPLGENVIRPRSLAERLKETEAGDAPPVKASHGHKASEVSISEPRRWVISSLLAALIVVSLIPAAMIGVMFWREMPWLANVIAGKDSLPLEAEEKSLPTRLAAVTAQPRELAAVAVQPKEDFEDLSATLIAPPTIDTEGGKAVPFGITLDSSRPLPLRSIITIEGLPEGTTLSEGRPFGDTEWSLRPDEIGDLRLVLPEAASTHTNLSIALVAADGTVIASATTRLNVVADPKSQLVSRPDEAGRIADLIAHGQRMIDLGYVAGARGYFKRAAEAGSADAALALGLTYDPSFIEENGVMGVKADLREAQAWYERAQELGSQKAQRKLEEFNHASVAGGRAQGPQE